MRKIVAAAAVIALTTLAVTGCSFQNNGQAEGKVKLRFASWDNAQDLDKQQVLVDRFNKSQDKIKVSLEAYGSDYDTKISAGMGSGDTPDLLYMWDYPSYYRGLEPLDAYVEKEGADFKARFYEALWPYNSIGDVVYGIPVGFTTHALFYNKDIFAKAGVAEPDNDWTWDKLREASKTISEKLPEVKGFAFMMKPDPYDFEMYLWSNGAAYVNEDGKTAGILNSDEAVEAVKMFQDMEKDGYGLASEKTGTDEFRSGQAAMYVYGAWEISTLKEDELNFGIVDIPAFSATGRDSTSILSSSGVSISKDSKNKEAAWEFVKYWTGEEMNKARIGYELPVLKSVMESEHLMDDPYNEPFYSMLEQSAGFTPASFLVKNWSKLKDDLDLAFESVYNPSTLKEPKAELDKVVYDMD